MDDQPSSSTRTPTPVPSTRSTQFFTPEIGSRPLSPIFQSAALPDSIILCILKWVVDFRSRRDINRCDAEANTFFTLLSISTNWKNVAENAPELWGQIFRIDSDTLHDFTRHLELSKDSPLVIVSTAQTLPLESDRIKIWDLVIENSHRISDITLSLDSIQDYRPLDKLFLSSMPNLQSVSLLNSTKTTYLQLPWSLTLTSICSPRLSSLHIHACQDMLKFPPHPLPQLTHLDVSNNASQRNPRWNVDQWTRLLQRLPNLRHLKIVDSIAVPQLWFNPSCDQCPGEIEPLRLESLHLKTSFLPGRSLLSSIRRNLPYDHPELQDVTIDLSSVDGPSHFEPPLNWETIDTRPVTSWLPTVISRRQESANLKLDIGVRAVGFYVVDRGVNFCIDLSALGLSDAVWCSMLCDALRHILDRCGDVSRSARILELKCATNVNALCISELCNFFFTMHQLQILHVDRTTFSKIRRSLYQKSPHLSLTVFPKLTEVIINQSFFDEAHTEDWHSLCEYILWRGAPQNGTNNITHVYIDFPPAWAMERRDRYQGAVSVMEALLENSIVDLSWSKAGYLLLSIDRR